MSHELSFFDFKRKFGLGHHDMQKITQCTLNESKEWSKSPAPKHIIDMINAISVVVDRIKTDNGIFTDVDAQHAAHIIEGLNKEIKALKETIRSLQDNKLGKMQTFIDGEASVFEGDLIRLDDQGIPRAIGSNVGEIIAIDECST